MTKRCEMTFVEGNVDRECGKPAISATTIDGVPVCRTCAEQMADEGFMPADWRDNVPKPVCDTCNDTHEMWLGTEQRGDHRKVMCTHCPTPCQKCRQGGNGPYCTNTPCDCPCHIKKVDLGDVWFAAPPDPLYSRRRRTEVATLVAREVFPLRPRCIVVSDSPAWADVYDQDAEKAVITIRVESRKLDALTALEAALAVLEGQL